MLKKSKFRYITLRMRFAFLIVFFVGFSFLYKLFPDLKFTLFTNHAQYSKSIAAKIYFDYVDKGDALPPIDETTTVFANRARHSKSTAAKMSFHYVDKGDAMPLIDENTTLFANHAQHSTSTADIISCHYVDKGDALPPIDVKTKLPMKSIFFHETSCRGHLNSRQACAVESTARAHPHWQINVLFSGPVTAKNLNSRSSNALKRFTNVKFYRIRILQYVKGTPVENLIVGGALNRSYWPVEHTSDILRLLTLSKRGGVYLDLDHVVVKSLEDLGSNWVVRETFTSLSISVLSVSRDPLGRKFIDTTLSDFKSLYRGNQWNRASTYLITEVLQKLCNTTNIMEMSSDTCHGFKIYDKKLFFPVRWEEAKRYFGPDDLEGEPPYAYHLWNRFSKNYTVSPGSFYARLAQKYCPTIQKLYGNRFGM